MGILYLLLMLSRLKLLKVAKHMIHLGLCWIKFKLNCLWVKMVIWHFALVDINSLDSFLQKISELELLDNTRSIMKVPCGIMLTNQTVAFMIHSELHKILHVLLNSFAVIILHGATLIV